MIRNQSEKKTSKMQNYLDFINRLPLDLEAKKEFVKAHVKRLKQYEQETQDNKKKFDLVMMSVRHLNTDEISV